MEKVIYRCNLEFGYEMIGCVPYAYWLYKNNLLKKSIGCKNTHYFYYFSPNHEEKYIERISGDLGIKQYPLKIIHQKNPNFNFKWIAPPYKKIFKNDTFIYTKPILIIFNKYTQEWKNPPVNFIDTNTLEQIIENLKDKYQLIYIRYEEEKYLTHDTQESYKFKDFEIIKKFNILTIQDIINQYSNMSFDEIQLKLFANTNNFISVQGGPSVMSSYFGGKNIILIKQGSELNMKSYDWYNKLSGANIQYSSDEKSFLNLINLTYD